MKSLEILILLLENGSYSEIEILGCDNWLGFHIKNVSDT
jgi:hypothetical protein